VSREVIVSFIIMFPVLLASLSVHEMAHAWSADRLGDPTPGAAGRLTLNPLAHLDLWGTLMLIATFAISQGGFFFGWAKPVPIDPGRLASRRWAETVVAVSGPGSNLCVAALCGAVSWGLASVWPGAAQAVAIAFYLNMVLAILNILPIPPLDGWRALTGLLPPRHRHGLDRIAPYEQFVFLAFLALVILRPEILSAIFGPPISAVADVLLPAVAR